MARSQSLRLPLDQLGPSDLLRSRLGRSFVPAVLEETERYPFRLRQIGTVKGWPVAICEAAAGRELPEYGERRIWRHALGGRLSKGILIYSDASHSSFVWSWFQSNGRGLSAYQEHRMPDSEGRLVSGLRHLPSFESQGRKIEVGESQLETALLGAFSRGLPAGVPKPRSAQECQFWIEGLETPADVRRTWHRLLRFTVLDNGSESTRSPFLAAIHLLEGIYLACLERMSAFVGDAAIARTRRRPEFLRDLRAVVDAADHPRSGGSRVAYARRLILQRNLFALVDDEAAGRMLAAKLRKECGTIDVQLRLIDANICSRVDLTLGEHQARSNWTRRSKSRKSVSPRDLAERTEILRFAWREFRSMRLDGMSSGEMIAAASQLRTRRASLLARRANGDEMSERAIKWPGRSAARDRYPATISFADAPSNFAFDMTLAAIEGSRNVEC